MPSTRPNILLIMTDQHRGDCLGIDGHPVLQTPYLDHLAASGTRFTRAYSACPVCTPARRTVITGRKPANHGALVNVQAPLPWPKLPEVLRDAGYRTHLVGKSHWGPAPLDSGFDTAEHAGGSMSTGDNDYQKYLREHGVAWHKASDAHGIYGNGWPARPWHLDEHLHFTNWCVQKGLEFIHEQNGAQPFFMWVNFIHPHQPFTPPPFYYDKYMAMDLPEPSVGDWARVFDDPVRGLDPEAWRIHLDPIVTRQMRAAYYGCIEHIDHQVARLIHHRVLPENTIVVFAADHGEMLGDHQWTRKRNPYEPSARVPLLIRFPRGLGIDQAKVVDRPVELMDIMPTLLDAVGAPIPDTVDGDSLLPIIRDPRADWRPYVHGECANVPSSGSGMQYLTDGKKKYVWLPGRGEEQFFDLQADPCEMHNLVDRVPEATLAPWRDALVDELRNRPESFVEGGKLVPLDGPTSGHLPVWESVA